MNEIENPFSLLKDESPFLNECLTCFSLLDGHNINYELTKEIFVSEKDLDTKLNNLSHKSELQYDQERKCYIIHEQTQIDIGFVHEWLLNEKIFNMIFEMDIPSLAIIAYAIKKSRFILLKLHLCG